MKFLIVILTLSVSGFSFAKDNQSPEYFARYQINQAIGFGQILDDKIQPLIGDLYQQYEKSGEPIPLKDVTLLLPTQPQSVFAVGMNFASHLSSPSDAPPPLFLKLPSSLITTGKNIELPKDATNVHFEGELVLIIGKQAKNISIEEADDYIFGVTVGNDITERNWQSSDLQWMRAKAMDGFGPIGSIMATGLDYNNLLLTTKLNDKIVQQENTKFMIHKPAKVVSYLSQYFTLMPGDLIYMGTPGRTQSLKHNDKILVSIEKVGMVENMIVRE
ncbi:fumarylacetoacetate hydrolase family protein [Marinicellulosiphila megalodicopiae]|uniref:fumarylacetoacetate hydrolase family protein n=1 Tax=Marinicellulosiphila megalodicopiae TaxID=2724896 RepID=UPI003BAEE8E2